VKVFCHSVDAETKFAFSPADVFVAVVFSPLLSCGASWRPRNSSHSLSWYGINVSPGEHLNDLQGEYARVIAEEL